MSWQDILGYHKILDKYLYLYHPSTAITMHAILFICRNGLFMLTCWNIISAMNSQIISWHPCFLRQASFKLSWWCKGDQSDQHKHDIVSFERGNITTAERSSKQVYLSCLCMLLLFSHYFCIIGVDAIIHVFDKGLHISVCLTVGFSLLVGPILSI